MSTMQSQQLMWQGRTRELPTSSKQQPGASAQRRPVGIPAGFAAVLLTALAYSLVLSYGALSALVTRNGYAQMALRQEVEDLQARIALLSYQVNIAESGPRVEQAAARLNMRPADPVAEVDYVLVPRAEPAEEMQVAGGGSSRLGWGLGERLAQLATEVVSCAEDRAEASTVEGHRP